MILRAPKYTKPIMTLINCCIFKDFPGFISISMKFLGFPYSPIAGYRK